MMKRYLLSAAAGMLTLVALVFAEKSPDPRLTKIADAVRKQFPDAKLTINDNGLTMEQNTIMYTMHSFSMTGEVSTQTYKELGPNYDGFVLRVVIQEGPYQGQAVSGQVLKGPYFPTYFVAVPTPDEREHYRLYLSYGSRFEAKAQQGTVLAAVGDAIGKRLSEAATRPTTQSATAPANTSPSNTAP